MPCLPRRGFILTSYRDHLSAPSSQFSMPSFTLIKLFFSLVAWCWIRAFQAMVLQVYEDYFKDGIEAIVRTVVDTLENRLAFHPERE